MISLIWPLLQRYVPQRYYLGRITTLTMEAMSATCGMNIECFAAASGAQLCKRSILSLRMDLQDASISGNHIIRRIRVVLWTWPHSNKSLSQYRYLKFDTYDLGIWRWEVSQRMPKLLKMSWSAFVVSFRHSCKKGSPPQSLDPRYLFFQYIPCYRYVLCLLEVIRFSMRFAESSA